MIIRLIFTIITSKLAIILCRLFRSGGTTFPGRLAQKMYPNIIGEITKDFRIIMVTGTNGKTTTTKIIGRIMEDNGIDYITNKSGANLISGIITTFIENVNFKGKSKKSTALLEIDEAAFSVITNYITPDILVVTNFFRDQLDRYGELYTTLKGVALGISRSKNVKLVLNSDDSLCASLGNNVNNHVFYYGFDPGAYEGLDETESSDANFCIYCKTRYEYEGLIYGHLGWFSCPSCGYRRPDADIACIGVEELSSSCSIVRLRLERSVPEVTNNLTGENITQEPETSLPKVEAEISRTMKPALSDQLASADETTVQNWCKTYTAEINLPGLYNIYNALAALACSRLLNLDINRSLAALSRFESGFGRMEVINAGGKTIKVVLVKNPTGFNQVLNYLLTEDKSFNVAFLINDNTADGTDISWLWDVDFEKLQQIHSFIDKAYVSGIRAEDMAVRLKYSGVETSKIEIEKNYQRLLDIALANTPEGHNLYILPTYTAMLDIRKLLKKKYKLKDFWR